MDYTNVFTYPTRGCSAISAPGVRSEAALGPALLLGDFSIILKFCSVVRASQVDTPIRWERVGN